MRRFVSNIIFISIFAFAFLLGCGCFVLHNHVVDVGLCCPDGRGKPSILLDEKGRQWGQFQVEKRKYVPLEAMPPYLIQAFLVTEDRDFFKHPGISLRGIVRSVVVNLWRGKKVQGASTITQQLVRLMYFNSKKTFSRKIKEQMYAILVERQLSKEQILEAYLNNVYFGYGVYGVQAAAQCFWGIEISDISIAQAATLASIMRSPQFYSPINFPGAVFKRRNLVLSMMYTYGMISLACYKISIVQPLSVKEAGSDVIAPYLKETIRIFLEKKLGKDMLYRGGLTIATTINIDMQCAGEKSFHDHIKSLKSSLNEKIDGGMITIDSKSGEIRVLIGGFDFKKSKFNRATQAYKQMGSVFKVFVYGAALEQGLSFADVLIDEPITFEQDGRVWQPDNYNKKFLGEMTRAYALSHSNNIVTIKTMFEAGTQNVVSLARRCHLPIPTAQYGALALGCLDVSVLQAVGAFNVIVNHGIYQQPHFLRWVKNDMGVKIYKQAVVNSKAMSSKVASQVARVLTFSFERFKKIMGEKWFGGQALGKTGTTNDSRICWFCGATPELTTAIYVGCDQNESLGKNVFGSKAAFPMWLKFHEQIENFEKEFYYDPSLREEWINSKTGKCSQDFDDRDVVALLV